MHVNHCNSCLLIISASISRSKPPANADRTLSLSWSPHFAPLYCTSAKTPSFSSTPSDSSICAWCVQELPTVTPAELVSDRAYAFQSYTGNAWAVDTVNNLITIPMCRKSTVCRVSSGSSTEAITQIFLDYRFIG